MSNHEVGLGQTSASNESDNNKNEANGGSDEYGYIQFITTYRTSFGTNVTRVATFGIQFANPTKQEGLRNIIQLMF